MKGENKGVKLDHDQYFITLKNTEPNKDGEFLIDLVEQYQTTQEVYASDVQSVKSELKLSETSAASALYGTLSQQALILVSIYSYMYQELYVYS